jgi:hypothetical protein
MLQLTRDVYATRCNCQFHRVDAVDIIRRVRWHFSRFERSVIVESAPGSAAVNLSLNLMTFERLIDEDRWESG